MNNEELRIPELTSKTETVNTYFKIGKKLIDLVLEQIKTFSNENKMIFYNEEFDPGSG